MRKIIWYTLFVFVGCSSNENASIDIPETDNSETNKPLISVIEIKKKSFKDFFNAQGQVISKEMAYIRPEINGTIKSILIKEGQYVKKGEPIFIVSNNLFNSQALELNEQISFAEYLFNKQKTMFKDGVTTEMQLKEAESRLSSAKKAKNTLLTQLEKSNVIAPFSGFVEEILVKVGESISPVNYLCQLVNTNNLFAEADVSENLLSEISENDPVSIYFPSVDLFLDSLIIDRIGKIINPINRTVKIECRLPKNSSLLPNLMGEFSINHYSKDSAICLPSRLILKNSKGETFVKVVDNNKVLIQSVVLGRSYNSEIEILSGLDRGAIIIDEGKSTVLEGQEVEILSSKE